MPVIYKNPGRIEFSAETRARRIVRSVDELQAKKGRDADGSKRRQRPKKN